MFRGTLLRLARTVLFLGAGCLGFANSQTRGQDAWDAIFLKGNKIGYVHTFIEKVSEKGRDALPGAGRHRVQLPPRSTTRSS